MQRFLLIGSLFLLISAEAAPWQFEDSSGLPRNLVVREHGRLKLQNTDKGLVRYFYHGKQLTEIRGPGKKIAQYVYEDGKLARIVHSDGTVDQAIPVGKNLVRIIPGRRSKATEVSESPSEFASIASTSGLSGEGGQACQLDQETGEPSVCSEWNDDPSGNGGDGSIGWEDYYGGYTGYYGGTETGGGETSPSGGGWEPNPPRDRAECYDRAYEAYDNMAKNLCSLVPTPTGREQCHAANTRLLAEYMTKCRADFPG